jgi:hypothetical protein
MLCRANDQNIARILAIGLTAPFTAACHDQLRRMLCLIRPCTRPLWPRSIAGASFLVWRPRHGAHRMNVAVLAARLLQEKWPELIAGGIFGILGVIVGIIFWEGWHGMMWF